VFRVWRNSYESKEICVELLKEMRMLGCKLIVSLIDQRFNLSIMTRELIDQERYQRLVGRLIYLSHMCPYITFDVSVVNRYMHDS
jgi:hypothetical protein